jgi:chloramphenicol-sensitive protein RarD
MGEVILKGKSESFKGFFATLATFMVWGFLPAYWKLIQTVSPFEILAHRIIWSLAFLVLMLTFQKKWIRVKRALTTPSILRMLLITGSVICVNWLLYIWAVNSDMVIEASLGYYITPLVNVIFGFIFFRDRLRKLQWIAIATAAAGVLYQLIRYGQLPWVSLGLALSFGTYALLKKMVDVESNVGLFVETLFLSVPSLMFLAFLEFHGQGAMGHSGLRIDLLLMGTGLATSIPLMTFVYGAKRLSLVTVGILQYLSPTISFFLGIFVYNEPFTGVQLVTFCCIWAALIIYTSESIIFSRKRRQA